MNVPHALVAPPTSPAEVEDSAIQLQREMEEILQSCVGMNPQFAHIFAIAIVQGMRERFGGLRMGQRGDLYIPAPSKADRDAVIRARWTGRNIDELVNEFGLSARQIYRIATQRRAR